MSWKIDKETSRKDSPLARFIKEANEHYKNHQQGSLVYIAGVLGMLMIGLVRPVFTPLETSTLGIFALIVLASYSAWRTASDRLLTFTGRNRFVLSCGHRRTREHRVNDVTTGRGIVHRIKMDSEKDKPIGNVCAIIQSLTKDGQEELGGLNMKLQIWDHSNLSKEVLLNHGVSGFIEFLCEYEDGTAVIMTQKAMGFAYEGRDKIEIGPHYNLHIIVSGEDAYTESLSVSLKRKSVTELEITPSLQDTEKGLIQDVPA